MLPGHGRGGVPSPQEGFLGSPSSLWSSVGGSQAYPTRCLGSREGGGWHLLVTARYVVVCTSPAALRAKHWNMPVSSGSSPLICRLPSARSWKRDSFSRRMRAASLYQAMSGGGTPARSQGHIRNGAAVAQGGWPESGSPLAWQGMATTFSISAVMCLSGSLTNCGGSAKGSPGTGRGLR